MNRHVAAVIATHARPREIERLLASMAGVDEVFICDNSGRSDIRAIVKHSKVPAHYIAPETNLGCGGGLRAAEELAWKTARDRITHLLVLDDDAVLQTDTVELLAASMERTGAVAAYPLILAPDGRVGWTPGLSDRRLHVLGEERPLPREFRERFGREAEPFVWAQGICLLATREAVEKVGFHRADFWVRGEDLDFSVRLTAIGSAIFVTSAAAHHLPPEATSNANAALEAEYLRHAAMVQNIAYLALTQRHGRGLRGSLPGAVRRFLRLWGCRAIPDLLRALWRGVARREPAGKGAGRTFQKRCHELTA
jgi:GT2 family glycosyltransferase